MTRKRSPRAGEKAQPLPPFEHVRLRARHDGWTPARQTDFISALAECGCVRDACRRVGMSVESAYALARRPEAQSFRAAWDLALDNAVRRITDEAFSRCIHGIAVPHFYKGEQVGEHRRYNDRLTMFLMRYRDPLRYGRHLDRIERGGHPERHAVLFGDALRWVLSDAMREERGLPRMTVRDIPVEAADWESLESQAKLPEALIRDAFFMRPDEWREAECDTEEDSTPDVASTSSTSEPIFPSGAERD